MKSGILTIGNEVTDGDITNTNCSWLASQLSQLGSYVTHHVSAPDDEALMIDCLEWLEQKVDWLFVTGGLGPTTDDRTREVISKWLGVECMFSISEWERLQVFYEQRGLKLRESHKHQCHFPENSESLPNPVGTALGFRAEKDKQSKKLKVVVLPGPPRELKAVFEESIRSELKDLKLNSATLKSWTLFGITESDAADRAEEFFKGKGLQLGYRASVPYVQVKVWLPEGSDFTELESAFTLHMQEYLVARNGTEPIAEFFNKLKSCNSVVIYDDFTSMKLISRLTDHGDLNGQVKVISGALSSNQSDAGADDLVLGLHRVADQIDARLFYKGSSFAEPLILPYKVPLESFRAQKYMIEKAIHTWTDWLGQIDL